MVREQSIHRQCAQSQHILDSIPPFGRTTDSIPRRIQHIGNEPVQNATDSQIGYEKTSRHNSQITILGSPGIHRLDAQNETADSMTFYLFTTTQQK